MCYKIMPKIFIGIIIASFNLLLNAQEVETRVTNNKEKKLKITEDAILRDNPPQKGIFYVKGQQIGTIKKNENLLVIDSTKVKYFFDKQKWIKVVRVDSTLLESEADTGWIYIEDEKMK